MIWPFKRKKNSRLVGVSLPMVDSTPDAPIPFGYKLVWWAVRSNSLVDVAEFINLSNPQRCNWESGVSLAYENGLFLTPPIDGWILICGNILPPSSQSAAEQVESRLSLLSQQFSEAQVFATHRVVDYHVWARAKDGVVIRGFGHVGESGETFWDEGFDEDEDELAFDFIDPEDDLTEEEYGTCEWPSEEHVMEVSRVWSICPVDFENHSTLGVGLAGSSAVFFNETKPD